MSPQFVPLFSSAGLFLWRDVSPPSPKYTRLRLNILTFFSLSNTHPYVVGCVHLCVCVCVSTFGCVCVFSNFPERSVVRERCPTFNDSFVEACLLLVGKTASVWGSLDECTRLAGGSGNPAGGVAVDGSKGVVGERHRRSTTAVGMLDMLLTSSGCRDTRARVSAREAFRFVWVS